MNQNKILNFPIHKTKNGVAFSMSVSPLSQQQKRTLISALLLSVFLVVTVINQNNRPIEVLAHSSNQNRAVASLSSSAATTTSFFEKSIISKYTNPENLKTIQVGSKPSSLEKLAFGTLGGNYLITFISGKVSSVKATSAFNATKMQQVDSALAFLNEYKPLLSVSFTKAIKSIERKDTSTVQEEFDLINSVNHKVGAAIFKFDIEGKFLSLQITKDQAVASNQ